MSSPISRSRTRRAAGLLAVAALAVGLAACSDDNEATPSTEISTVETTVAADAAATEAPATDAAASDAAATEAPATEAPAPETTAALAPPAVATTCPPADGSAERKVQFAAAPPMCIDAEKTYTVTMETSKGTMTFVLDPKKAPQTVNNFVVLARYHYFDGITFHRVVRDFVIQGGDPDGNGTGGPGYTFADELPDQGEYKIGSLAMANAGPNTNGSQFFIITGANGASLPPSYSLFGQLTAGDDVMQAINALGPEGQDGPPSEAVAMTKVTVAET